MKNNRKGCIYLVFATALLLDMVVGRPTLLAEITRLNWLTSSPAYAANVVGVDSRGGK